MDIYAYFLKFVPKEPRGDVPGEQDVSQGMEGDSGASPEG